MATFAYPARFARDAAGDVTVTFRDVPEAITGAVAAEAAEAPNSAAEALDTALAGYINARRLPKAPSAPRRGEKLVAVDQVIAAKLLLFALMQASGTTHAALARKLGCKAQEVGRLLDGDHATKMRRLEEALAALGARTALTAIEVPAPPKDAPEAAAAFTAAMAAPRAA